MKSTFDRWFNKFLEWFVKYDRIPMQRTSGKFLRIVLQKVRYDILVSEASVLYLSNDLR